MLPRGGGAAAGVSSFDTRTGAVTFTEPDLELAVAHGANTNVMTSNGSAWVSAASASGGTVTDVTSTYFGITNPTGPTVDIEPVGATTNHLTAGLLQTPVFTPNGAFNKCDASSGAISFSGTWSVPPGLTDVFAYFVFLKLDATANTVTDPFDNVLTNQYDYSIVAYNPNNGSNSNYLVGLRIGGATVTSVFGRGGAVVATLGDYTAAQVTNAADKNSATTQTFSGIVNSSLGLASPVVSSGAMPSLSTIMSHVAALTLNTADQNTTGRDIVVTVALSTTTASNNNVTLQISADNVTYTTCLRLAVPTTVTGSITDSFQVIVKAGYWLQWSANTGSNISIAGTPIYY